MLPAATVVQAEAFPATSTGRNSTWVSPSAETATDAPVVADDQVVPLLVDVRYW